MSGDSRGDVRTSTVGALGLATLMAVMPVTLLVPVLKRLVQDSFQLGDFATSAFMSVNMVGAALAAPLAGLLSDRWGRRKPLVVGALLVDAVLLVSIGAAKTYPWLMTLRFFEGAAHICAVSTILAMAADAAKVSGSGRTMGFVGAALTLGIAIGAPLGGFLGRIDLTLPVNAGAGIAVGAAIVAAVVLRESPSLTGHGSVADVVRLLRRKRDLLIPYAFAFVDRFTVGFFITAFPLWVGNVLGGDSGRTGVLLAMFLLPFALLCYPVGRLSEGRSRAVFIGGGSVIYGLLVAGIGFTPLPLLPVLMLALGVCSSVMFVPTLMLTGELSGPEAKATAMGGFNAAGSFGFLTGPLVAGSVSQLVGDSFGPGAGYTAAFAVAGVAEVLCVAVTATALFRLERRRRI